MMTFNGGTLIVAIACKQGVVMCSDRRVSNAEGGIGSETRKLVAVGRNAIYGVTGTTEVIEEASRRKAFDVEKTANAYLHGRDSRFLDREWGGLCQHLADDLERFVDLFPPDFAPPRHQHEVPFYTLPFFYRNLNHKVLGLVLEARAP